MGWTPEMRWAGHRALDARIINGMAAHELRTSLRQAKARQRLAACERQRLATCERQRLAAGTELKTAEAELTKGAHWQEGHTGKRGRERGFPCYFPAISLLFNCLEQFLRSDELLLSGEHVLQSDLTLCHLVVSSKSDERN